MVRVMTRSRENFQNFSWARGNTKYSHFLIARALVIISRFLIGQFSHLQPQEERMKSKRNAEYIQNDM